MFISPSTNGVVLDKAEIVIGIEILNHEPFYKAQCAGLVDTPGQSCWYLLVLRHQTGAFSQIPRPHRRPWLKVHFPTLCLGIYRTENCLAVRGQRLNWQTGREISRIFASGRVTWCFICPAPRAGIHGP